MEGGVFVGQVAIVTGGGQGLGRAMTEMLVKNGAKVVIFDMDETLGEETAKSLGEAVKFYKVE